MRGTTCTRCAIPALQAAVPSLSETPQQQLHSITLKSVAGLLVPLLQRPQAGTAMRRVKAESRWCAIEQCCMTGQ
jgi:hypothetical protein